MCVYIYIYMCNYVYTCVTIEIPLTTCARVMISVLVAFTYPLQCNPSRRSILNIIRYLDDGREPTAWILKVRYYIITVLFLVSTFMIAFTVEDLGIMIALVGATGSTVVSLILPGGFYYALHQQNPSAPKWKLYAAATQVIVGIIMIPLCLTFIFMSVAPSH